MVINSVGHYQVLRELGRGGMGQVFLARDQDLGRLVALKFRHASEKEGAVEAAARNRFRTEARALAALNDAGIVTIYEIGRDGGGEFIAMEYVDGMTLRDAANSGELDRQRLLSIMGSIAQSLHSAHRAGILHRDIKPENIMLSSAGEVKVVDFGIARQLEDDFVDHVVSSICNERQAYAETLPVARMKGHATQSKVFGTPAYMAPELIFGFEASPASDVYALGISLYELVAARSPYKSDSVAETVAAIVDPDSNPPTLYDLSLASLALSELVTQMISAKPTERPDMNQVRERLSALAIDEAAAQPSPRKAPTRGVPGAVGIGLALLATLVMSADSPSAYQAAQAEQAEQATQATLANQPEQASLAKPASELLVAIAPIGTRGGPDSGESSNALADLLATALRSGNSLRVAVPDRLLDQIAPAAAGDPAWDAAASAIGAQYIISAVLREKDEHYYLQAEIRELDSGESFRIEVDAGNTALDQIVLSSAARIAQVLEVELGEASRPGVRKLSDLAEYESALRSMQKGDWLAAIVQLEKALEEDPQLFEAWYRLALARSWGGVAPALAARAAKEAERLSTSEHDAQLMRGLHLYLRGDFTAALATLRPLHEAHPGDRDVLYHLAEAVYHDGNHRQGVELFDKLLEHSPRFLMAAWHPFQRSLIDRDELKARRYRGIIRPGNTKQDLDLAFALGEYETLAGGHSKKHQLQSQVVLRRDEEVNTFFAKSEAEDPMAIVSKLAWALSQDNETLAASLFHSYWELLEAGHKTAANDYVLLQLGEVLITGGLREQTRELLEYWQKDPEMDGSLVYQELSIHAAQLLDDPKLTRVQLRNTGLARKASAIRAELDGDSALAEKLWRQSLADPHHYASYLDRAAQIRILRTSGERLGLNEACTELEKPAVYRPALMTARCSARDFTDQSELRTAQGTSHGAMRGQALASSW